MILLSSSVVTLDPYHLLAFDETKLFKSLLKYINLAFGKISTNIFILSVFTWSFIMARFPNDSAFFTAEISLEISILS